MTDKVLYQQDGHIVTIVLNDPGMRNPISEMEMVDGIVDALDRLNADRSVRVAILTGAGTAFSSGGDLRKMRDDFDVRHRFDARRLSGLDPGRHRRVGGDIAAHDGLRCRVDDHVRFGGASDWCEGGYEREY